MGKNARKSLKRKGVQRPLPLEEHLRGRLHAFVVETGLTALHVLLEEERAEACGARYAHDPQRRAHRNGHARGELVLGGRRVAVRRPRARTMDGQEVALPSWGAFAAEDPLSERTLEQMVVGVSTRKYDRSLEAAPEGVPARGASKSAVSRRFVAATREHLHEFLSRPLGELKLAALLIDGVHFAEHVILTALGIDEEGRKHVLGVHEGATENAESCRRLLGHLVERGLPTDVAMLVVIDGSKALRRAVRDVFGARVLVQRCQAHKRRNVEALVTEHLRPSVRRAMNEAYRTGDAVRAKRLLENLARHLENKHPGAAASLREGLEETLTVTGLGLSERLDRFFSTTNAIENLIGTCERVSRRVTRWRGGEMILRWMVTGLEEAARGFRRIMGYRGMPTLVAALRAHDATLDGAVANARAKA